MVIK
ncbi:hypothetical protein D018_0063A, partial [Vibrio parahaemolyticus VP2007-007]|jgi:hypothetical protein